ncbi:hypothetical protein [Dethiobacter alkaliphilus]|uniref:hypothetical protein n=1 Tax=Dethiobacter alkaliphilus TaxID=427926 RepID=UPI0022273FDB|nr:hypothetical protein [Dethiobacter alkaliphilus]MCW3490687.1 hypothetical protein [Dethiobacter alkaliphilus]
MLSKLLKYELKATARIFLPLYLVLFSFAFINRIITSFSPQQPQTPQVISMIIYVSILVGMFVVTFVMMLQRFYKNLLSEEGYLMFTLPTKTWNHIISKLLVAMMWIIASGIAAMISILIISATRPAITEFLRVISEIPAEVFTASSVLFMFEMMLIGLASLASGVLIIYASIAIGHLFNQHRIIASVGAFIALSTITQILVALLAVVFRFSININNSFETFQAVEPMIHIVMWVIILTTALPALGYFLITNYILSNRLNLE